MLFAHPDPNYFSTERCGLLEIIGRQAVIAVQNARWHNQVKQYASDLELRVAGRTAELEHERQHLQAILDSAGEGIQLMDPDWRIQSLCALSTSYPRRPGFIAARAILLP